MPFFYLKNGFVTPETLPLVHIFKSENFQKFLSCLKETSVYNQGKADLLLPNLLLLKLYH
jgi:hypothetical protein